MKDLDSCCIWNLSFFGYLNEKTSLPPKSLNLAFLVHLVYQNTLSILNTLRFHGQKPFMAFTNLHSDLVSALFNFTCIDLSVNCSFLQGNQILHLIFLVIILLTAIDFCAAFILGCIHFVLSVFTITW